MAERVDNLRWIDPQGGFGDLLILSGVMKEVFDRTRMQYNVVSCHGRRWLFADHPAVRCYGRPPKDATIEVMNYGYEAEHQQGGRPYSVLARMFGLNPPGEERLYAPLSCRKRPLSCCGDRPTPRSLAMMPILISDYFHLPVRYAPKWLTNIWTNAHKERNITV